MESPKPIADSIQKYIDAALTTVPEGAKGAIVGYVDVDGSYRGVVALKHDRWTIAAHVEKPHGEPPSGGAAVSYSWG